MLNLKTNLLLGLALLCATPAFAYTCPVYPRPQQCSLQDATTKVENVQVLLREGKTGGMWNTLPADTIGAYALEISPGKLTVYANEKEGVFYAKQTLSQLLEGVPGARNAHRDPFPNEDIAAVARKGELPCGTLVDWPDLPFRGTVEGYYGTPWGIQARLAQFDFYGRNKMNTYIYAPKDDPYHHGLGCYKPYPEAKAQEIRKMVESAKKNHIRFVWAIHPANTVNWGKNGGKDDMNGLCRKLEQMYTLGVRSFGVLVDDSHGEIGRPERQVQLCNYILENFIRKHKDVNQTLIMCPTGYNKGWATVNFLNTLGNGLDKSIPVMWTGDTVVHDITLGGQKWVNEKVKRPTFIWWNWPCTDFKRSRLSMGRTYGLDTNPEMKHQMSGFVANPMEQAEAGKIGLFGVADYTWNITAFNSHEAWNEGIARLYPKVGKEMQVFCRHNSELAPNTHEYSREESVDIAPTARAFVQSIQSNAPDAEAAKALEKEFAAIEQAGATLLTHKSVATLRGEIEPWFKQFKLLGQAGKAAVAATRTTNANKRKTLFFRALDSVTEMNATVRMDWNGGKPRPVEDVEVAAKVLTPAMRTAFKHLNTCIYAEYSGIPTARPRFTASAPVNEGDALRVTDRNSTTFWAIERRQQEGDWICLDFGAPKEIRDVTLLMGGKRAEDYAEEGVFEVSDDGKNWNAIGSPCGGPDVQLDISKSPARARMLRYRITKPRQKWLSVRVFDVNCNVGPYVTTNMQYAPNFSAFRNKERLGINRIMELSNLQSNENITLKLPSPVRAQAIIVYLENKDISDWAKLEVTMHDGRKKQLSTKSDNGYIEIPKSQLPKGRVKALRLTNKGKTMQGFKMTSFCIALAEGEDETDPKLLSDSDLSTFYNCARRGMNVTLPVPAGAKELIVVGSATCQVSSATPGEKTPHAQRFTLNENPRKVTITAPKQPGTRVNEIIFR